MSQKDYPELEGKKVNYFNGEEIEIGIVAGCNYDIGISIDLADAPGKEHLACIHGPAFNPPDGITNYNARTYKTEFYALVRQIKKGLVNPDKVEKICSVILREDIDQPVGSPGRCAFTG